MADGVVTETKDGIPQNVPGANSRAVPITLETVGGNHVIVDIGGGKFAFYAHMQPGSLRVKVGEHVKTGEVLGLWGTREIPPSRICISIFAMRVRAGLRGVALCAGVV